MTTLHLRRTLTGFVPADAPSEELIRRFKATEVYKAEITKPRNWRHHCLFMALLNLTYSNQETYTDPRMFRRAVALEAGHVEQLITLHGEPVLIPLSYSYAEIPDEDEFTERFGQAMAVCARYLHETGIEHLAAEVDKYAFDKYGITA